ncbi:MAG: N-acetyltransferase [Proteobacteria bacterium]|nr:N-acetyltransferase [Pseudomonadota bacterium]
MRGAAAIRAATAADAVAIARIYNHYVSETIVSFEESPVSSAAMAARLAAIEALQWPWLVAELAGDVCGYAYADRWKARAAYQHTVEVTIYLDEKSTGRGLGTQLYGALFERLGATPAHAAIGVISLPNPASVALHEKFGLHKVAHFSEVGRKFGRWVDVGYWQRLLPGKGAAPG